MKTAGATQHAARMRRVPVWVHDDERIAQHIKSRFPKADIDQEQRRLASRMLGLIYLYYKVGATREVVAEQLKMTPNAVMMMVRRVNRAMSGLKSTIRKGGDSIEGPSGVNGDAILSMTT
jgi:hypothetical protein